MKTIVINGFNSFIGNHFYKRYKKKYKIIKFNEDINKIDKFKIFTKKNNFDHFIHFAALSRLKCEQNKIKCKKTNFTSLKKIIDHLNKLTIKPNFIFISSSHVYDKSKKRIKENYKKKPDNLYGKLKLNCENYIKKKYKKHSILRLFNVYGKNQPLGFFINDIKKKIKKNKLIGLAKSERDFIHVNDVVKIIEFFIVNKFYGEFNVGSGNGIYLSSIVKMISSKIKIKVTNISDKLVADITKLRKVGYKLKINKLKKINLDT